MNTKFINCLCCNADNGELIIDREKPRHFICKNCGFVYMNPIPDFEANKSFYETDYWQEHHQIEGLITQYNFRPRHGRMAKWLKNHGVKPNELLIEIGCGFGFNLDFLRTELGIVPEGLEPSKSGVYNTINAFNINCYSGGVNEFNPGKKYDVALMSHVLEHFDDPLAALEKAHSILNKNGVIWIEVPNILYPTPNKLLDKWLSKEHISYFSPGKLKWFLETAGFQIIKEEYDNYCCVLAQKAEPKLNVPFINEFHTVKKALRMQRLNYFKYKVLKKFKIDIYKKYQQKSYVSRMALNAG